jgi:hypothetical protein
MEQSAKCYRSFLHTFINTSVPFNKPKLAGNKMRKDTSVAVILLFLAVVAISFTPQVHAASIYAAKEDGTITSTFEMGEKVRIVAYSGSLPIEIIIKDPEGVTRHRETVYTLNYDKILSGITDQPGWWEVTMREGGEIAPRALSADPTSTQYLTSFNNVIPEVPLGTLSILIAFFAAFSITLFRKRSKLKFPM